MVQVAMAALAVAVLVGTAGSVQEKPKAIKDVMTVAHKGGANSMLNKITGGKGTPEDHKKLLEAYEALATFKPPQGDEKGWKEKTGAMVAAAKDVVDKKEGSLDKLKTTVNCKACHDIHRPK